MTTEQNTDPLAVAEAWLKTRTREIEIHDPAFESCHAVFISPGIGWYWYGFRTDGTPAMDRLHIIIRASEDEAFRERFAEFSRETFASRPTSPWIDATGHAVAMFAGIAEGKISSVLARYLKADTEDACELRLDTDQASELIRRVIGGLPALKRFLDHTLTPIRAIEQTFPPIRWDGRLWLQMFGRDGKGTWFSRACAEWPVASPAIMQAAEKGFVPDAEASLEQNVAAILRSPDEGTDITGKEIRLATHLRRAGAAETGIRTAYTMLLQLPEDWWPTDPVEMAAATRIMFAADFLTNASVGLPVKDVMAPCRGRWKEWEVSLTKRAAGELVPATLEALDMIMEFQAQVVGPATTLQSEGFEEIERLFLTSERNSLVRVTSRLLLGDMSLGGIFELAAKWHTVERHLSSEMLRLSGRDPAAETWPPAVPNWSSPVHPIEVVALTSSAALIDEGALGPDADGAEGLQHCVGGISYTNECLAGTKRILSIRRRLADGTFERLSTAELQFDDGPEPKLVQHQGPNNISPPPLAADVLREYLEGFGGLDPQRTISRGDLQPLPTVTQTATRLPKESVETMLRLWEPLLKRPLRGLSVEELREIIRRELEAQVGTRPSDAEPEHPAPAP